MPGSDCNAHTSDLDSATVLHSALGEYLATATMKLDLLAARTDDALSAELESIRTQIVGMISQTRSVIRSMRNPDRDEASHADVSSALKRLAGETGTTIAIHGSTPTSSTVRDFFNMAARELCVNAITHGKADHILVSFERSALFERMSVQDNGRGMDEPSREADEGFGTWFISRRSAELGGAFSIGRAAGGGTSADVFVPIAADGRDNEWSVVS